ncbi:MAG: hypothetical protein JJ975_08545 [Bacteroidia bacterium]|nr:hypothetical protein [Bacteroidia bacterium]
MEVNSANGITYYVSVPEQCLNELAEIRHWPGLEVGHAADCIWIKGQNPNLMDSPAIRSLTGVKRYTSNGKHLFEPEALLPALELPKVSWSEMKQILPITRPRYNPNYFGLSETLKPTLVRTSSVQKSKAQMVSLESLEAYVFDAPGIRLTPIVWTVLNRMAILIGSPVLPLTGKTFWHNGTLFIQEGFDLEVPVLAPFIRNSHDPAHTHNVFIEEDGSHKLFPIVNFRPLSRSSFNRTMAAI